MQHLPVCQQFPETPNGICSQYLMESKHVTLSPSLPHIIQLMVILPGSAKLDFLWLISTISILIVISSWTTGWVSGWSWVSWCFFFYNIYILYIQYTISLCLTILHIYILYINNIPRIYIYIPYLHLCRCLWSFSQRHPVLLWTSFFPGPHPFGPAQRGAEAKPGHQPRSARSGSAKSE
jgi:hypothetical protein